MLSVVFLLGACTGEKKTSSLKLEFPKKSSLFSSRLTATTAGTSRWGYPSVTNMDSVTCYAVTIAAPTSNINQCSGVGASLDFMNIYGQYAEGATAEIPVEVGAARTISVLAFQTADGTCGSILNPTFNPALSSKPLIIGSKTIDIVPGDNEVNIQSDFANARAMELCTGPTFAAFADNTWPSPSTAVQFSLSLLNPSQSPGNIANISLQATGVQSGDLVTVYSDRACTQIASSTTSTGTTAQLDISGTLTEGTHTFYADYTRNGLRGFCSGPIIYTLDQTPPSMTFQGPSQLAGNASTVFEWTATYSGADSILLSPSHVSLSGANAGCAVTISELSSQSRKISVSGCSGNGTMTFALLTNSARDLAGNEVVATGTTTTAINVDNVSPTVTIQANGMTEGSAMTFFQWNVGYTGADQITLSSADVMLAGSGNVGCAVTVSGTGTTTRVVGVSGCTGNGPLYLSLQPGTARDFAGNLAPAAGPSNTVNLDNTPPTITFGMPSPLRAQSNAAHTLIIFPIEILGASTINLSTSHIQLTGTPVGCTATLGMVDTTKRNILITGCTGTGTLGVTIQPGAARDAVNNNTPSVSSPQTVTLDPQVYKVQFEKNNDAVSEGSGSHGQTLRVVINPPPPQPVTLEYRLDPGFTTATSTDTNLSSGSISIPPGSTSVDISYIFFGNLGANISKLMQVNLISMTGNLNLQWDTNRSIKRMIVDDDVSYPNPNEFVEVSAGGRHTCGITRSGTLKCWGSNSSGQLGIPNVLKSFEPLIVDVGTQYLKVSAGTSHTCAITSNNLLKCWGSNHLGQIGNNLTVQQNQPTTIDTLTTYTSVAAGSGHNCAITTSGNLKCWGNNNSGQIGTGVAMPTILTPQLVEPTMVFAKVATGNSHSCAIRQTGELYCWGSNSDKQIGDSTAPTVNITPRLIDPPILYSQISTGSLHTCGITTAGYLRCWGKNTEGQGGVDPATTQILTPRQVGTTKYLTLSLGSRHSCGITETNSAHCWGQNDSGQLGNASSWPTHTPQSVDFSTTYYNRISTSQSHSCGITSDNVLKCWGLSDQGQAGMNLTNVKFAPENLSTDDFVDLVTGDEHICGLKQNGELLCLGKNFFGELGNGGYVSSSMMEKIDPGVSYAQISGKNASNCGITLDGVLKCWGSSSTGQTGTGSFTTEVRPKRVSYQTEEAYSMVSQGNRSTCGVTKMGGLRCWGDNVTGQLGDSSTAGRSAPVPIDTGLIYSKVSIGTTSIGNTCGILQSGGLKCWGENTFGQVGDGSTTTRKTPTPVEPSTTFIDVSVSGTHSCAITTTGVLKCWGRNSSGELGNNTQTNQSTPIVIDPGVSYSQVAVIASTSAYSCGVTTSGVAKCWGDASNFTLGTGDMNKKLTPTIIDAQTTYRKISLAKTYACGITTSNKIKCWGTLWTNFGGIGLSTATPTPIAH